MSVDGRRLPSRDGRQLSARDYMTEQRPTWCPGCGDFGILAALREALLQEGIAPHEVILVSGIGCGSKLPDYMRVNGFLTLHGRPLPIATGFRLANPSMRVLVVDGDGDAYGIGGNHWLHTCRRNPGIVHLVENNQIYALTKGQYSPTTEQGTRTTTSPEGAIERPVNPLRTALAAGATFVARGFAGEPKDLARLIREALHHRGYALVDILQPCITYNKVNTYDWYAERIVRLEAEGHDPSDFDAAWERAGEFGERIPVGILYRTEEVPAYEEKVPGLQRGPLVQRPLDDLDEAAFEALQRELV
ncbi:MAG: 2-oxoacid:ferredoxin oxidoreductase subunit beta [Bacillota bacterium]|nr:2-oxoacid:ferredoxin oxidoreductase subunit beta [Bacillota bacterium]